MDSIYSVLTKETSEFKGHFIVKINPNHAIFKGHFPEFPIVPGAVLLQMLKELVEETIGKKVKLKEAQNIKFIKMILPSNASKIEISLNLTHGDNLLVKSEFKIEEICHCKITALY